MRGCKILVVEDQPLNLELVTDLLELGGHSVLPAATAEEGLNLVERELPDLILMDLSLPGMDGLTATRIIKGSEKTRGIRVIALTAHAMAGDRETALAAGCEGFISKPIDTRKFLGQIEGFMNQPIK